MLLYKVLCLRDYAVSRKKNSLFFVKTNDLVIKSVPDLIVSRYKTIVIILIWIIILHYHKQN